MRGLVEVRTGVAGEATRGILGSEVYETQWEELVAWFNASPAISGTRWDHSKSRCALVASWTTVGLPDESMARADKSKVATRSSREHLVIEIRRRDPTRIRQVRPFLHVH